MGFRSSQLKDEAGAAKWFAEGILATMDRRPAINALCCDLDLYREQTGLTKLTARREKDLKTAAKKLDLLLLVTPDELCFVRLSGNEYNRTDYLIQTLARTSE